jgi:hypothetical protein
MKCEGDLATTPQSSVWIYYYYIIIIIIIIIIVTTRSQESLWGRG